MNDEPGYIYLIRRDDGWYRIGRTSVPRIRFRQWRWMARINHWHLEPILLLRVGYQSSSEKMMHNIFAARRTTDRKRGMGPCKEWFRLTKHDVIRFLFWAGIIADEIMYLDGCWDSVNIP